jgi:DNA/RNA-binding domain of Phe-tRNA-synthetase-like protein
MKSFLTWDSEASNRFPKLLVCVGTIRDVKVEHNNEKLETLKRAVTEDVRLRFKLEQLKDDPTVRAYRDLFWSLGIDPTKTRPSGEALLRRVLHGDAIPNISTVVDAYNLASVKTVIPLSGFDLGQLSPPLIVRFSRESEEFFGIGMNKATAISNRMLVLADTKRIVCIYPHRDADATKITEKTKNVVIVGYGATGIALDQLTEAVRTALSFISQTSGGKTESTYCFPSKI